MNEPLETVMRLTLEPSEKSNRHALVKLVYTAILTEVTEGRLPADARLIQDELAQAYGVSRQPVQQALLLLRDHGIVLEAPRRGFVVAPLSVDRVRYQYQVRTALGRHGEPAGGRERSQPGGGRGTRGCRSRSACV